ncbi:hypothetical protein ACJ72_03359 [Emergomyces africanus]|uniref:Uncharacterized protein n=1 Tax=Emergomyces africanus TaxID=1955775 RepID=A0A1B7NZV0_9EURO|nr:hypothetical protein ACJ72_03359 [Emergomyces africanus]
MLGTFITNLLILPIALLITIPLAFTATITISIAFATLCLRLCLVYLDFLSALTRAYFHSLPTPTSTATTIYPRNRHLYTIYNSSHRRNHSQTGTLLPAETRPAWGHSTSSSIYTHRPQFLLRRNSTPRERRRLSRRNSQGTSSTLISPLTRKYSLPTPGPLGNFVGEGNLDGDFEPIDGLFQMPAAATTTTSTRSEVTSMSSSSTDYDEHD